MKGFIKFLLILLLIFGWQKGYTKKQGREFIDSLIQELPKAKEDTNKIKLLTGIAQRYMGINADSAVRYGTAALALANQVGWDAGSADANYILAWSYRSRSEYLKAIECCNNALAIWQEKNEKQKMALVYQVMSVINIDQSDYPKALELGLKSLKISEEIQDKRLIGGNLTNIGIIYDDQGDLVKAMEYHTKALEIFDGLNDKYTVATSLANIGLIYKEQKNYDSSLETLFKALKIGQELGLKHIISKVSGYIGAVYTGAKNYPKALEYLDAAEKIDEEAGDKAGCAEQLQSIGSAYLAMATDSGKIKEDKRIPGSKQERLKKAVDYFSQAAAIHRQIGNLKDLAENYRDRSTALALSGNYKDALENHKQYMAVKDSVFSEQNKEKLKKLEIKRDIDLKDKQIQIDKLEVAKKRNESIFYIAGIILLLLVIVFIYRNYTIQKKAVTAITKANKAISAQKQVSETLLLNILPADVAEELKARGKVKAKLFDNVSVLMTDFVDFTVASERMAPEELIEELHNCFEAFDHIAGKYKIEKIKTVGDAYVAVSGLPNTNPGHAIDIVKAAIEIRDFVNARKEKMGDKTFGIRIGINSGKLVAGIVGVKKFAYDIWGDTVNTATRMEQKGEEGKINISQATYELVKETFNCEYRGEIEAKNKGVMKMYFVNS